MGDAVLRESDILIVDDHVANVRLLEQILSRSGALHLRAETDGERAVEAGRLQ